MTMLLNIISYLFYIFFLILSIVLLLFLIPNKYTNRFINFINEKLSYINKKRLKIAFVAITILLASSYIFLPGLIEGHDYVDRLAIIQAISNEIKRGCFPALIMSDYVKGYGLGLELIYTDFFYYIPAFLCVIGVPLLVSYKIFQLLMIASAMYTMSLCVRKITKSNSISLLLSSLYVLSSYFFTDLYIRADIGENLAMIFIPLVILGLYEIIFENEKNGYYFTIGLVGVYLAHILSCFIVIFLVVFIILFNVNKLLKEKRRIKYLFIYGLLSIGVVAFYWITMFDTIFGNNLTIINSNNSVNTMSTVHPLFAFLEIFYDDISKKWIPPGIGIVFLILIIKTLLAKNDKTNLCIFSKQLIIIGLVFLLLTTSLCPWDFLSKYLSIIEFPWRFYMITTVCFTIGCSYNFVNKQNRKEDSTKLALITIVCMMFTYSIFTYNLFIKYPMYISDYELSFPTGSGVELPYEFDRNKAYDRGMIITSNNDVLTSFEKNGTRMEIVYSDNTAPNTFIDLPLTYYSNYVAKENGKDLVVEKSNEGYVRVMLENSEGTVNVHWTFTNPMILGLIVTVISIGLFIIVLKKTII